MSVDLSGGGSGGPAAGGAPGFGAGSNNGTRNIPMNPMAMSASGMSASGDDDFRGPYGPVPTSGLGEQAKAITERGVQEIRAFVEKNPSQVRAFVFAVALGQVIYCSLGIVNIFALSFTPVEYMVNIYLLAFGIITCILEGKAEWPGVQGIQEKIFFQAHFLSTIYGRAFFFCFEGTFGMARLDEDFIMFLFGMAFFGVGVLIIMQQWKAGRNIEGPPADVLLRSQYGP